MRILIDYQILVDQKYGGVSKYTYNLYSRLLKRNNIKVNIPILFSRNYYFKDAIKPLKNYRILDVKIIRWTVKIINAINTVMYYLVSKIDIYHPSFYGIYLFPFIGKKAKVVVTIHDMIHEIYKDDIYSAKRTIFRKKVMIEKADVIIAVSGNTKKDIMRFYPEIEDNKIKVIYEGGLIDRKIRNVKNIPDKYVLYVGNREGYKNFSTLIKAMDYIFYETNDIYLVCVGGGKLTENELNVLSDDTFRKNVIQVNCDDAELNYLYQKACCYVNPSKYEGFGIPIIEAFENSCPVILANASCFPEIGGNACLYFEADSVIELSKLIISIIENGNLREKMIKKGLERSKLFSWDKMENEVFKLYTELLEEGCDNK